MNSNVKKDKKQSTVEESEPALEVDTSNDADKQNNDDWEARYHEADAMCMRALADYRNLAAQKERERADFIKYANENLILELLPVYDNLKSALQCGGEQSSAWYVGVQYVAKQLKEVLTAAGIEELEAVGKPFDHTWMEAVEGQGETVMKELTTGYKLHGKLIQAAKVIVNS